MNQHERVRPAAVRAIRRACRSFGAALLAVGFFGGCLELPRTPGVMFSTAPAGARVVVDGVDSGFVTPCHVDISRDAHHVDMVLEGYKPVSVLIEAGGQTSVIFWDEAWIYPNTWRFPLWLNARDGVFPIKIERSYSPARVYAALRLADAKEGRRGRAGRKQ